MSPSDRPWTVLYDPDCGFCKWTLTLLLDRDRDHLLRPLALGTPEADELLSDLSPEARMASWHMVAPDGIRTSGGAAVPEVLNALHTAKPLVWLLAAFPRATDRGYRWVADHRSTLSRAVPRRAKAQADARLRERSR